MKTRNCYLFSIVFLIATSVFSQEIPSSENALKQYEEISEAMSISFPEDDIKTFSRASFSQLELETYLTQHFQRMDLLRYIKDHHTLKLYAYLHSGNWLKAIGFPKESVKSYQDFFEHYYRHEKDLTTTERDNFIVMRFFAHGVLAENYANLGMFDKASEQHEINMRFTKDLDNFYYPSSVNNYGLFLYWHKKELDSALVYFNRAYEITKAKFPNHTLIGSIRDNIADIYVDQKKYEKAQPLYATNFEFYDKVVEEQSNKIDIPRLISAGTQLVITDLELNRLGDAQISFNTLVAVIKEARKKKTLSPESQLEYWQAKEELLKKQNNIEAAYTTSKQIKHYADSLHQVSVKTDVKWQEQLNDITVDRIALNFKYDQLQKETKIKNQRTKLWISGLVSSVFIILLLFLVLSRHQHLINSKNKQLLAEQNLENSLLKVNQLNTEIISKERDLSDFAINLIQNQEWASGLAAKMEAYKMAEQPYKKEVLNDLEQVIKNKITFDQDTTLFFERLDKLSDAFYSQLMTKYPNLSKNEIQLCSLIRLKMDSRSIATLQNITTASLNTSRYRLRKKLELSDDVSLDDFIQLL